LKLLVLAFVGEALRLANERRDLGAGHRRKRLHRLERLVEDLASVTRCRSIGSSGPAAAAVALGAADTTAGASAVRLRVVRASRGAQTPWVARRELFGDFTLAAAAK